MLNLFIKEYGSNNVEDSAKVGYLSDIVEVIDDVVSTNTEDVLENEEFQKYRGIIESYISNERYDQYFEQLIREGKASGIHLQARRLFISGEISYKEKLSTPAQTHACNDILALLSQYEHLTRGHEGCQFMRLRLTWMHYNGAPIFSGNEYQFTKMTADQWKEINYICTNYEKQFLGEAKAAFNANTIYYVQALSFAQIGDYTGSANAFRKLMKENFAPKEEIKYGTSFVMKVENPKNSEENWS